MRHRYKLAYMLLMAVIVIIPLAAMLKPVSAQGSWQSPYTDETPFVSIVSNVGVGDNEFAATPAYTPMVAADGFPPFWAHTVGLRSYGTVVAVGDNYWGQCGVGITANFALSGDADGDGDVDVFDWVRVKSILMGL